MNLDKFKIIFWDFDGVIKESVSVKTETFIELFKPFGEHVCEKVKNHHLKNGGMSRFDKIPIYLEWSGLEISDKNINQMCSKFGNLVKQKVINSKWVSGVKKFIEKNHKKFIFIIVSATPQKELIEICKEIYIDQYFYEIYGAPLSKSKAIKISIERHSVFPKHCLMFGDSQADIIAAKDNNIDFILRRNLFNQKIKLEPNFKYINDFNF